MAEHVALSVADGACMAMLGDASLLFEALGNLIDNARKLTARM